MLDILLGNGEFIFVCKVLRERAALDLFTPVQLPNIWVLPWEQERPGAVCVCEFYGETFPSDGAELCQIYLVLGFSKGGVGLVGISSHRE